MPDLLRVADLRAGYGEAIVIDGVGFTIGEGESLALLGRNGTGKTTLLATLVGVTRYRAGTIELAGRALTPLRPDQRAAAGTRLGAAGAQHLPLAHRRREFDCRGAAWGVDARARLRIVSAAGRATRQSGDAAFRRRAADAGDRSRAWCSIRGCCCSTSRSKGSPR